MWAVRRAMRKHGCEPLAVHSPWSLACHEAARGKAPIGAGWQNGQADFRLLGRHPEWSYVSSNTGMLLGFGEVPVQALDIDVEDAAAVAAILDIARRHLPAGGIVRVRPNSPRCAVLFRCEPDALKQKLQGERGAVERQAKGQQLVVHGWHPSGVRYLWQRPRAPWTVPASELPLATEVQVEVFLGAVAAAGVLGAKLDRTAAHRPELGEKQASPKARRREPGAEPCDPAEEMRTMLKAHNGAVVPAMLALVQSVGARGTYRHDTLVSVTSHLVCRSWPAPSIEELLVEPVNEHFKDGDWRLEILRAIAHAEARQRDAVQAAFDEAAAADAEV